MEASSTAIVPSPESNQRRRRAAASTGVPALDVAQAAADEAALVLAHDHDGGGPDPLGEAVQA